MIDRKNWTVVLTDEERRICVWVAKMRQEWARKVGAVGRGPSTLADGVIGVLGEYACSLLLNLFWRPHVGIIDQPDVGGCVETKTIRDERHRLCFEADRPEKVKPGPHVLVLQENEGSLYRALGWITSEEAAGLPTETHKSGTCVYVQQDKLHGMDALFCRLHKTMA